MKERYIKISEDTIPEVGKEYSITFEFTPIVPPETPLSETTISNILNTIDSHMKATYPISGGRRVVSLLRSTTLGPYYGVRVYYTIDSTMTTTFRDCWNEMKDFAKPRLLDLSSPEFYLVKQTSYWWVWLILSGVSIGTIIAIIKRKG